MENDRDLRVLSRRTDFGGAIVGSRRVGLFSRRRRDLHPQGDGSAARADASQTRGITFRHRADGLLARRNRQKQSGRRLGPGGNGATGPGGNRYGDAQGACLPGHLRPAEGQPNFGDGVAWSRSRTRRWNCSRKLCLVDEREPTARQRRRPRSALPSAGSAGRNVFGAARLDTKAETL